MDLFEYLDDRAATKLGAHSSRLLDDVLKEAGVAVADEETEGETEETLDDLTDDALLSLAKKKGLLPDDAEITIGEGPGPADDDDAGDDDDDPAYDDREAEVMGAIQAAAFNASRKKKVKTASVILGPGLAKLAISGALVGKGIAARRSAAQVLHQMGYATEARELEGLTRAQLSRIRRPLRSGPFPDSNVGPGALSAKQLAHPSVQRAHARFVRESGRRGNIVNRGVEGVGGVD